LSISKFEIVSLLIATPNIKIVNIARNSGCACLKGGTQKQSNQINLPMELLSRNISS